MIQLYVEGPLINLSPLIWHFGQLISGILQDSR